MDPARFSFLVSEVYPPYPPSLAREDKHIPVHKKMPVR